MVIIFLHLYYFFTMFSGMGQPSPFCRCFTPSLSWSLIIIPALVYQSSTEDPGVSAQALYPEFKALLLVNLFSYNSSYLLICLVV